jgi:hypothetical protein
MQYMLGYNLQANAASLRAANLQVKRMDAANHKFVAHCMTSAELGFGCIGTSS